MAKKRKEKIHITLLSKNLSWKTNEYRVEDGCFIFRAKISVEKRKTEETREINFYPGANTDVVVDKPIKATRKKKREEE